MDSILAVDLKSGSLSIFNDDVSLSPKLLTLRENYTKSKNP